MKKTRVIVYTALFIAMDIILRRLLAYQAPTVRIDFGFLPLATSAMMFGPIIGGLTGALADILGMMIMPKGPYFPGFTVSALMTGVIYGLFLYNKPRSLTRTVLAALSVTVVVEIGLNTIWLSMLTGQAAGAIIGLRLVKAAIMFPAQIILIQVVWKYIAPFIQRAPINDNA